MPPPQMLWAYVLLVAMLVVSAVTDVRSGKIYNAVTLPALAAGLIGHTLFGGLAGVEATGSLGLIDATIGMLVGFAPMFIAWRIGGANGGDAKLMAAVGALTGMWFAMAALFYGLFVAAAMAVVLMIMRGRTVETLGRIWRFVYVSLAARKRIGDPSTPDSPKVPLGLALCVGAGAAMLEFFLREGDLLLDMR